MTEAEDTICLRIASPARMRNLGEKLGKMLEPGSIILLTGPLGSGKTTLTQGIAKGLQSSGVINSPTFTLLKEHTTGRIPLYHFDFYRVDDQAEVWSLGFDDYFSGQGVCVIEWAERTPDIWGDDWLWIRIEQTLPQERMARLHASGPKSTAYAQKLKGAIR